MPGVLLCCSVRQAHRGVPLGGVLLCRSVHQALKGAPWVGSYSVVQYNRHLMGQPLYCSAADAGSVGRERLWRWLHPLRMTQQYRLASMAFLHRHFPPQSPPSGPLGPSLCSQQQLSPWDCSTIPMLQLPAAAPSRGPVSLSGVHMAAARTV